MADDDGFKSALDPGVAAAAAAAMIESVDSPPQEPPREGVVTLPGGLRTSEGRINEAEVRELTGEAEEILARSALAKPNNLIHFVNSMLEWGVVRFGFTDPNDTKMHLKNTLVGDRDALIIGIRRTTYGDDIEMKRWICPSCGEASDLVIPLDDIPVHEPVDKDTDVFEVKLRKGGTAEVRLANGGDQLAVFSDNTLSSAERDTILISRCVLSITDKNGNKHQTAGFGTGHARNLNMADRHTILHELNERQPGPRLGEMKFTHDTCQNEVDLMLTIADLFQDIIMV